MKSNLLLNKILSIQDDYQRLLTKLLPKLQSVRFLEALDEINLFWVRHIDVVQLYLKTQFPSNNSYVFTAATYMDFEDREHLPFLLMGENHVLDDPLGKYSEICAKMLGGSDAEFLYKQISITARDNLKILENLGSNILILPLRLLSQSNGNKSLYDIGERAFISFFDGIEGLNDFFEKCRTIKDIMLYARKDIANLVLFSECDDHSLPFENRFKIALSETEYMIDISKPDSYNFFIMVFGSIQQAIDVIFSCLEYGCIPYIRYPVALHYVSLLSESMIDIEHILSIRYRMSVAFVVYHCCDKDKLSIVSLTELLRKNQKYNFNSKLFHALEQCGINQDNFLNHKIAPLAISK